MLIISIDLKRVDITIFIRLMKSNFKAYLNLPNIIDCSKCFCRSLFSVLNSLNLKACNIKNIYL